MSYKNKALENAGSATTKYEKDELPTTKGSKRTTKLYKYTITVFDTSPHAGNMILDSIGGGDPFPADYDMEECDEGELISYGATILGSKIVSVEYANEVKSRK